MKAMMLETIAPVTATSRPLVPARLPDPVPDREEVVVEVLACGVCHTELDEIEGRTPPPVLPVIPGHEAVGRVVARGSAATALQMGQRVGIGWFHSACGTCSACRSGLENLCPRFKATGRDAHGGYAHYMRVPHTTAVPIPETIGDVAAAPLLCAGAVGYRALVLSGIGDHQHLGLTGFGASGHIVLKMVRHCFPGTQTYVFARREKEREFAISLGACWAGGIGDLPPHPWTPLSIPHRPGRRWCPPWRPWPREGGW
jgi:propanol-preferring alcohol dehydrogenase